MQPGEKAGLKMGEQLRKSFGDALLAAAKTNERVVVLDGDLGSSTGAHTVRHAFPERFWNVGIAEANMVGIASGLASNGYIPWVTSLASFLWANAFDQIRLSVGIAGVNVKFMGSHAGLTTGREGPTSMSIEDLSLAGAIPCMTIIVPCDKASMHAAVAAAVAHNGPVYVRSSRDAMPIVYDGDCPFAIGKANVIRQGTDVTIFACGLMIGHAMDAAAILGSKGISARVVDMHTLRPLDRNAILAAAQETGAIVTAEEHLVHGGMGANIARIVAETHPVPMRMIGVPDLYPDSGSVEELMAAYKMTADDIAAAALDAIAAKRG
jgi:transketolase